MTPREYRYRFSKKINIEVKHIDVLTSKIEWTIDTINSCGILMPKKKFIPFEFEKNPPLFFGWDDEESREAKRIWLDNSCSSIMRTHTVWGDLKK